MITDSSHNVVIALGLYYHRRLELVGPTPVAQHSLHGMRRWADDDTTILTPGGEGEERGGGGFVGVVRGGSGSGSGGGGGGGSMGQRSGGIELCFELMDEFFY